MTSIREPVVGEELPDERTLQYARSLWEQHWKLTAISAETGVSVRLLTKYVLKKEL